MYKTSQPGLLSKSGFYNQNRYLIFNQNVVYKQIISCLDKSEVRYFKWAAVCDYKGEMQTIFARKNP